MQASLHSLYCTAAHYKFYQLFSPVGKIKKTKLKNLFRDQVFKLGCNCVYNYEFGGIRFKESGWKIRKSHSVHSAATARKSRASYCCTLCSLHSDYFKQQHGKHQWHVLASATALQFSSSFSIDPISYKTSSGKITVSVFLTLF